MIFFNDLRSRSLFQKKRSSWSDLRSFFWRWTWYDRKSLLKWSFQGLLNRHCNVQIDIRIRADELGISHSFTRYEWLNRDCDAQICIGITSRWTGYYSPVCHWKSEFWHFSLMFVSLYECWVYDCRRKRFF
jgi:hypothetical protein